MILIKGFLRKKTTKLYIKIFTIIISVIFLITSFQNYSFIISDSLKYHNIDLIMYAKEDKDSLLKNQKRIKDFHQSLSFKPGKDNDVTYNLSNNTKSFNYERIDWKYIISHNNIILTFPASFCDVKLKDKEILLALDETYYNPNNIRYYLNKEINFEYNNKNIILNLKNIINPKANNYICISDNLYNKLLLEEKNYIYEINTESYKKAQELTNLWRNLETNNFYNIIMFESNRNNNTQETINRLESLNKTLKYLSIIFITLFLIISIVTLKEMIFDEQKDFIILKQLGYNKMQNSMIFINKLLLLNIILFVLSFLITNIVLILINNLYGYKIVYSKENFYIFIIFIFIELLIYFFKKTFDTQ